MALARTIHNQLVLFVFILSFRKMYCKLDEKLLSKNLLDLVNKITSYKNIQKEFEQAQGDFIEVNGSVTVFAKRLEKRFQEKTESLRLVKEHAEQTSQRPNVNTMEHYDKTELSEEKYYPYPNMRDTNNESLTINPQFSLNVPVNMSKSFVHVPTNIYAKSLKVLNLVEWTKTLDSIFIDNFNRSKNTLLYQYYGDHSGFLRVYPGNNNNYSDVIDLYDCRRRPWYVQATSSPKDVVIIIDLSGSMIGSNIGIAKIATASLIDTLEENDFFNVITVSKNVTYMEPCLTYLLQATKKNKETMKNLVQAIKLPRYELNHILGLETAFELLNSGSDFNRSYAGCNRAIMFITDGIESDYIDEKKLFKKYNADKSTRVFTYLVGRKKSPDKKALIQMACENNGYFYKLETLGNVWDTVLEYLHVMSRPLVAEKTKQKAMYTPVYLDSTGIGMVMSISMGVFNTTTFLGVAGTDISIKSLYDIIPHTELGVFGHAFIITNNGFIVMHPQLRLQPGGLPSPPNILLEDLERAVDKNEIKRVKKEMIDRKITQNENNTFPVYFIYDVGHRKVSITNATYNHLPINDTEFSAGVVVSEYEMRQFDYKRDDSLLQKGIQALELPFINMSIPNITIDNYTYVNISPWNYLNITASAQANHPYSIKVYPTAAEIFEYLKGVTSWATLSTMVPTNFSTRLVVNLLTSAGLMAQAISDPWVSDMMRDDTDTYESMFIATAAGYSKLFTYSNLTKPYDRDILKTPIFQHAIANPDAQIIFSAPYTDRDQSYNNQLITVVAPIRKGIDNVTVGVTGMKFKGELLKEYLENATSSWDVDCSDNRTAICALLDQNGYVLASNLGPSYIGRFIGEESELLIDKLVDTEVLKAIDLQDTQADCRWVDHSRASANLLLTPAKLMIKGLIFLVRTLAGVGIQASIFIISMFQSQVKTSSGDNPDIRVSCTKKWQFYLFQRDQIPKFNEKTQIKKCHATNANCKMTIKKIQIVPDTNMLYLEVRIGSCDNCRNSRKKLDRTRVGDEFGYYCANHTKEPTDKAQKYRRRPSSCFNVSKPKPDGGKHKCGRSNFMKPCLWTFVTVIFLSVIIMT